MLSVRGCFSGDGWRGPFVRAKVAVPRLAAGAFSPLPADTGADRTAIRRDGRQLLADTGGRILPPDAMPGIPEHRVRYGPGEALLALRSEQGPAPIARLSIGGAPDRHRGIRRCRGGTSSGPSASSPACRADRLVITQPR